MKKRLVLSGLVGVALIAGIAAQAQAATPGKWRSDYRVSVNGQDSQAIMLAWDKQVSAALPSAIKSGARTGLNIIGNQGSATVCVTPQVAATWTSALSVFNMFSRMNSLCRLVAGQPNGGSLPFTGRCDDPNSFTGNVSGTVTMPNSWQWGVVMEGVGKFPAAVLTAMKLPATTVVPMKTTASSSLISPTCQ